MFKEIKCDICGKEKASVFSYDHSVCRKCFEIIDDVYFNENELEEIKAELEKEFLLEKI